MWKGDANLKILQFIYGLNVGGAETFIINLLESIDGDDYKFSFVIQDSNISNNKIKLLCDEKKYKIYIVPKFNVALFKHIKELRNLLDKNNFDCIHIHMNAILNIFPILIANKKKIKIVLHSHSTKNNSGGLLGRIIHILNRVIVNNFIPITRVACGVEAGKWMYGNKNFYIVDNAIALNKYAYNENYRMKLINKYSSKGYKIIGHVGRFTEVKNHDFILRCFSQYLLVHPKSILCLVGDGPLKKEIQKQTKILGIEKSTIFVGNVDNVNEFYSYFDCILFPSLFEGLPFVLIEAQVSGLPIICSDRVTKDIKVTDIVSFLSLNDDIDKWIKEIDNKINMIIDRQKYCELFKGTKYDIKKLVTKMKQIYRS